jgi:hypothetical protein
VKLIDLMDRIDAGGVCWEWTGTVRPDGYTRVWDNDQQRRRSAHLVVWEALVGLVPKGLELHHVCENRTCVDPDHMMVTTHSMNMKLAKGNARRQKNKTHCPSGHPYAGANLRRTGGRRYCRTCDAASKQRLVLRGG